MTKTGSSSELSDLAPRPDAADPDQVKGGAMRLSVDADDSGGSGDTAAPAASTPAPVDTAAAMNAMLGSMVDAQQSMLNSVNRTI